MKKVLLIFAVLLITASSFGQTEKGNFLISGSSNLSFSSSETKSGYNGEFNTVSDVKQFNIKPTLGYFVVNNLAIGLSLDYEHSKQNDYKSNQIVVGPALRYYFGSSNIKPYLEGDYITGFTKYDEGKIKVNGWDLGAGVAFFLNDHISLDLKLGYGNSTAEYTEVPDYEIKTKGFALSAGFSILF